MNMPLDYINTLYAIAETRLKEEEKQKEREKAEGKTPSMSTSEALALEDELEGVV